MELNWKESKQYNNKNYTKTLIDIVEDGLPNDIVIKLFRIIFNNGNNLEVKDINKEACIKILNSLQETYGLEEEKELLETKQPVAFVPSKCHEMFCDRRLGGCGKQFTYQERPQPNVVIPRTGKCNTCWNKELAVI